jgi:hypothetical protein
MTQHCDSVRDWNTLLAEGVPILAIYLEHGTWITGRIQGVRRYSAVVWYVQPLGLREWRELKTYRSIWRDGREDAGDTEEKTDAS